jgi:hypothetical protein
MKTQQGEKPNDTVPLLLVIGFALVIDRALRIVGIGG